MSRPYIVFTPKFDPISGGCQVIHRFAHELNARGQEAYISSREGNPEWNTPYYGHSYIWSGYEEWKTKEDVIGVYPEITFGNPLDTRTVVRYLLNNAGKLAGDKTFPESNILFAFSHMFNDFNLPEERVMFMPILDTDFFHDAGLPRDKIVFYNGKGWRSQGNDFVPSLSAEDKQLPVIEITKGTANDQSNLRLILQTTKRLYCYDNITAMTEIARLCGCPVVIMPNGEYTKEQYDKHEFGWNGLGWGEPPEYFDSAEFKKTYLGVKEAFYPKLDRFIEITQNA